MWIGAAVREEQRQQQAMIEHQQREGYTYEWVHTQLHQVSEFPAPSNRRSDMLMFMFVATKQSKNINDGQYVVFSISFLCFCVYSQNCKTRRHTALMADLMQPCMQF